MSELNFKLLPAALLIKNFVKGNPDSNDTAILAINIL